MERAKSVLQYPKLKYVISNLPNLPWLFTWIFTAGNNDVVHFFGSCIYVKVCNEYRLLFNPVVYAECRT